MRMLHVASSQVPAPTTLRALATVSVLLIAVETVGARWEQRIALPPNAFVVIGGISSNHHYVVGGYWTEWRNLRAFVWHRGELRTFAIAGARETGLNGVNSAGDLVGSSDGSPFLQMKNGTITRLSCPFATWISPRAINDGRTVVGSWENEDGTEGAFRWQSGQCERLPLTRRLTRADISHNGIIVGTVGGDEAFHPFYGVMIREDQVTIVEHPQAPYADGHGTTLAAVAPNGLAVGAWYRDVISLNQTFGGYFLYRDGMFEDVNLPGSPLSISSSGLVTCIDGEYVIRTMRVTSVLADR